MQGVVDVLCSVVIEAEEILYTFFLFTHIFKKQSKMCLTESWVNHHFLQSSYQSNLIVLAGKCLILRQYVSVERPR